METIHGPYIPSILNNKISLSILEVGKSIKQNLEKKFKIILKEDAYPRDTLNLIQ